MVMEQLGGTTLQEFIRLCEINPDGGIEHVSISVTLCRVLAFLHSHTLAIVHADLSPSSILFTVQW